MKQLGELDTPDVDPWPIEAAGSGMKFLDEYRDETLAGKVVDEIRRITTKPWVLMEVCGGQTHTIVKYGIDRLLPDEIELVHGPGCPVCVTSLEMIDKAHAIAQRPDVIFCSFGDMLRVPGSEDDLLVLKSRGADIRVVYSPIDCLKIARANPDKKVVFFAIGFETTAPANAMSVFQAQEAGNQKFLDSRFARSRASVDRIDPAIAAQSRAGISRAGSRLHGDGLPRIRTDRARGSRFRSSSPASSRSIFCEGVLMTVRQLEAGDARSGKSVSSRGAARRKSRRAESGESKSSRCAIANGAASVRFRKAATSCAMNFASTMPTEFSTRRKSTQRSRRFASAGSCFKGVKKPHDCPAFGKQCTPETSTGRNHGVGRRRVRRILRIRTPSGKAEPAVRTMNSGSDKQDRQV